MLELCWQPLYHTHRVCECEKSKPNLASDYLGCWKISNVIIILDELVQICSYRKLLCIVMMDPCCKKKRRLPATRQDVQVLYSRTTGSHWRFLLSDFFRRKQPIFFANGNKAHELPQIAPRRAGDWLVEWQRTLVTWGLSIKCPLFEGLLHHKTNNCLSVSRNNFSQETNYTSTVWSLVLRHILSMKQTHLSVND